MDRFHETTSASAEIALTDEETLLQSQFMCDAVARGLFNPTIDSQTAYTIFVPLNGRNDGARMVAVGRRSRSRRGKWHEVRVIEALPIV